MRRELLAVDVRRVAVFEINRDVLGLVRCLLDGHGHHQASLPVRLAIGVLDLVALVGDVPEVAVARVDLFLGLVDRDLVELGVVDGGLTVGQAHGVLAADLVEVLGEESVDVVADMVAGPV